MGDKTIQRFLLAVGERRATKLYKLDHCVVPNVMPKHNIPNDAMVVKYSSPNTASVVIEIIIVQDRVYVVNNVIRWNFVMSASRTLLITTMLILILMLMLDNNNNTNESNNITVGINL